MEPAGARPRAMVLGGEGFLGSRFRALWPDAAAPRIDIADRSQVARALDEGRPEAVVNCAGKTGRPNIDWCESHKEETLRSNLTGALVVMEECLRRGIHLTHLGSGCVYQGDNGGKGWSEDDPPNFAGSFYSRTKAWAEAAMREFPVLLLRLRLPFDGSGSERCLIAKLARYPRVLDEPNSVTCVSGLLSVADALVRRGATGVFNVVNEGAISPFAIMGLYREEVEPGHRCEPLPREKLGEVAIAGRSSCVLDTSKLRALGLALPPAREALRATLRAMAGTGRSPTTAGS